MRILPIRAFVVAALLVLFGAASLVADNGPNHRTKQTLPVKLGTSGGNVKNISSAFCCSGTLGSLVTKGGVQYILSNNHVLADTDTGTFGDDVSQPGLVDVGCNKNLANIVADLSEWVALGTKNVDAAIAAIRLTPTPAVDQSGAILDVGVPASALATPTVGGPVAKSGRTTGLTCASIGSINTDVSVQYQKGCNAGKKFIVKYTSQVVINSSSFSAGGDSGSLIVTSDTAQPVALLYAGSSTTTVGNPIQDVTNALSISFVGSSSTHSVTCPSSGQTQTAGRGPSPSDVDRATAAKERHADRLMADPAIQGVGVGAAEDNPEEAVVVIYVEEGRAHGPLPDELDGVRTQIIRTDRFRAFGWNEREAAQACTR